jgi:hypothetical protein
LAGAFEGAAVLVALVEVLASVHFLTCFLCFFVLAAGALEAGASVEGFGVAGVWAANERAAARAVPNIKVVKRFIVLFLLVGRFLCPHYERRDLKLTRGEACIKSRSSLGRGSSPVAC